MAAATIEIRIKEDGSKEVKRNLDALKSSGQSVQKQFEQLLNAALPLQKALQQLGASNSFQQMVQQLGGVNSALQRTSQQSQQLQIIFNNTRFANSRQILQDFANIATVATAAARAIGLVRDTIVGITNIGFDLGGKFIGAADDYTRLSNRIRQVTSSEEELQGTLSNLFNLANRTRTDIGPTVELYQRLRNSTKELGLETSDAMRFTENMMKLVASSGATSQEAAGAIRQLTQALGSGTLRGQELNSVLEQLPAAADLIAMQLGVTRGQLKELGKEGQLTSDIILKGILNASQAIDTEFAKSVPTVDSSLQVLKNQMVRAFGNIDQELGITRQLSGAIIDAAGKADLFLIAISRRIQEVFPKLKELLSDPFEGLTFEKLLIGGSIVLDQLLSYVKGTYDAAGAYLYELGNSLASFFENIIRTIAAKVEELVNKIIGEINKLLAAINGLQGTGAGGFLRAYSLQAFGQEATDKVFGAKGDPYQIPQFSFGLGAPVTGANAPTFMGSFSNAATAAGAAFDAAFGGGPGFFQTQANAIIGIMEKVATERQQLEQQTTSRTLANYDEVIRKAEQFGNVGSRVNQQLGNSFNQLGGQVNELGNMMQQTLGRALQGLEDSLVQFVMTGKLDFKSLINSILSDLARMVIRMMIIRPLMGFFGGIFGGFMGFSTGGLVPGFATGGRVNGPGTSTSDSILARLSAGEFVVNAAATRQWFPLLHAINDGAALMPSGWQLPQYATGGISGSLPGFATGGIVGGFNGYDRTFLPTTSQRDYGSEQSTRMTQMISSQVNAVMSRNRQTAGSSASPVVMNSTVNVTVSSRGDAKEDGSAIAKQVEAQMKSRFLEMIHNEQRPGGKLYSGSVR